ncbi:putative ADP-ribosylation factor-like protein 5C isoform X2 [Scleropages formosus]|nr:uncharacterized protein LOC108941756 isoform X2 [Scleropages formosus]
MWDIGGQESLRASWNSYYCNTEIVILVVDSTDRERLTLNKEELHRMLAHEVTAGGRCGGSNSPRRLLRCLWKSRRRRGCDLRLEFPYAKLTRASALAGSAERGRPDPGEQAGHEELDVACGDIPVPDAQLHHGPLLAHPGMLRSHRRGATRQPRMDALPRLGQLRSRCQPTWVRAGLAKTAFQSPILIP